MWVIERCVRIECCQQAVVMRDLVALESAGLVVRGASTGAFRYAPAQAADRSAVDAIAEAHVYQRLAVSDAIAQRHVRALASAFKFKK